MLSFFTSICYNICIEGFLKGVKTQLGKYNEKDRVSIIFSNGCNVFSLEGMIVSQCDNRPKEMEYAVLLDTEEEIICVSEEQINLLTN